MTTGSGRRRLYLMRHGHVDYFDPAMTDPRMVVLTADGRAQAAAAGRALQSVAFDFIGHSGLPRTIETARIVAETGGASPQPTAIPGLEELKSGSVLAQSREELAAWLAFSFDEADAAGASFLPGGETFAAAQDRIVAALEALIERADWRTALVVAHEGVNRIALGWVCGGGLKSIGAFEQDLACVNVIDFDIAPSPDRSRLQIERAVIKALNVTPYDYAKSDLTRTSLEHLFDIDFGRSRPRKRPSA